MSRSEELEMDTGGDVVLESLRKILDKNTPESRDGWEQKWASLGAWFLSPFDHQRGDNIPQYLWDCAFERLIIFDSGMAAHIPDSICYREMENAM
jgi:hypothetical protein